jgi:hypothetical protein
MECMHPIPIAFTHPLTQTALTKISADVADKAWRLKLS